MAHRPPSHHSEWATQRFSSESSCGGTADAAASPDMGKLLNPMRLPQCLQPLDYPAHSIWLYHKGAGAPEKHGDRPWQLHRHTGYLPISHQAIDYQLQIPRKGRMKVPSWYSLLKKWCLPDCTTQGVIKLSCWIILSAPPKCEATGSTGDIYLKVLIPQESSIRKCSLLLKLPRNHKIIYRLGVENESASFLMLIVFSWLIPGRIYCILQSILQCTYQTVSLLLVAKAVSWPFIH